LYGLPSRARTNLSSLLNENRSTANIRSNSSWESPILRVSSSQTNDEVEDIRSKDVGTVGVLPVLEIGNWLE
jgi:hypothetical protein